MDTKSKGEIKKEKQAIVNEEPEMESNANKS